MALDLLQRRRGTLVAGRLLPFLRMLLQPQLHAVDGHGTVNLQSHLDASSVPAWRVKLLDWMALGELGLTCLDDGGFDTQTAMRLRAAMYGHIGRYRDAAVTLAAAAYLEGIDTQVAIEFRISAASTFFMYGDYVRAWYLLHLVRRAIRANSSPDLVASLYETRMMMRMKFAQIADSFHLRWLTARLRARSRELYDDVRNYLEDIGAHGRLQALEQNAERLGIAQGDSLALPTSAGYKNLGLIGMHSIVERDRLRNQRASWTSADVDVARVCAKRAVLYGWHHEAWKFHWLLVHHGPPEERSHHLKMFRSEFAKTQYHGLLGPILQRHLNKGKAPAKGGSAKRHGRVLLIATALACAAIVTIAAWRHRE